MENWFSFVLYCKQTEENDTQWKSNQLNWISTCSVWCDVIGDFQIKIRGCRCACNACAYVYVCPCLMMFVPMCLCLKLRFVVHFFFRYFQNTSRILNCNEPAHWKSIDSIWRNHTHIHTRFSSSWFPIAFALIRWEKIKCAAESQMQCFSAMIR